MNSSLISALLAAVLVWPGFAAAEIYKHVDRDGVVHYSDEPAPGAKAVELPEISVYPFRVPVPPSPQSSSETTTSDTSGSSSDVDDRQIEEEFRILEPENNATLLPAGGVISIRIVLQPELQHGQSLALMLDGRPADATGTDADFALANVTSGSHILEARVIDGNGHLVRRAKSVLFHVP